VEAVQHTFSSRTTSALISLGMKSRYPYTFGALIFMGQARIVAVMPTWMGGLHRIKRNMDGNNVSRTYHCLSGKPRSTSREVSQH
jgi:hypothetical protein